PQENQLRQTKGKTADGYNLVHIRKLNRVIRNSSRHARQT
ncbi:hypothetical protein D049_1447B, partial [Vibrio parahaemolyticus VPTS-2010]